MDPFTAKPVHPLPHVSGCLQDPMLSPVVLGNREEALSNHLTAMIVGKLSVVRRS